MTAIITPGQARAEALGIEQPDQQAQQLARGLALGRIQSSLDAASMGVALVAATLLGHGLPLAAFAPPRAVPEGDVGLPIDRLNKTDASDAASQARKIQGALGLAGQLVAAGHAIAADMLGMVPSEPAAEEQAEEAA